MTSKSVTEIEYQIICMHLPFTMHENEDDENGGNGGGGGSGGLTLIFLKMPPLDYFLQVLLVTQGG